MAHDPVAALPLYTAGAYNYTVFVAGEAVGTAALAVHAGPAGAASVVEGVAATYVAGDAGWVAIHAVDDWGNRLTQVGATGLAGACKRGAERGHFGRSVACGANASDVRASGIAHCVRFMRVANASRNRHIVWVLTWSYAGDWLL
jgi:hypothetical protein